MQLNRTFKTKLYPTASQKALIYRYFGASRFIFNKLLSDIQNFHFGYYQKDTSRPNIPSKIDLNKRVTELKSEFPWLNKYSDDILKSSAENLHRSLQNFYRGSGFPKFKSRKSSKQSFLNNYGSRFKLDFGKCKIPKDAEWLKFSQHSDLPLDSKITNYAISKDSAGEYFISISYKFDKNDINSEHSDLLGCDLGLKETLICSDGTAFPRLRLTKKFEQKLARNQRKLSKKVRGSQNYKKQRIKVAKIHRKISRIREFNNHNISKKIVKKSNKIAFESLDIKKMMSDNRLSKAIADVGWAQLLSFVEYKLAENQGKLYKIDRFFASSQICSNCGSLQKMPLHMRIYSCPECGIKIDRDLNAALNIQKRATEEYPESL